MALSSLISVRILKLEVKNAIDHLLSCDVVSRAPRFSVYEFSVKIIPRPVQIQP